MLAVTLARQLLVTPLLDFICCGLGAAIVLWILSASWLPQSAPPLGSESLVVRCRKSPRSPPAEIGIEFRAPNQTRWSSFAHPCVRFSAESDSSSGGEAFLVLQNPEPGSWQFRPYLRDFPAADAEAKPNAPVVATLHFWGACRVISKTDASARMLLPGEHGPTVEVSIPRRAEVD